jgi:hypothetical protein
VPEIKIDSVVRDAFKAAIDRELHHVAATDAGFSQVTTAPSGSFSQIVVGSSDRPEARSGI